jgi:dihydrofolate reductase
VNWVVSNLNAASGFVLGRRTYEGFARHWPNASEEEQPVAEPLNEKPKYVVSTTLSEPLEWNNSTLLNGDLAHAVSALKGQKGDDLLLIGSATLARSLIGLDLIDEFRLMIDPSRRRRQATLPRGRHPPAVGARGQRGRVDRSDARDLRPAAQRSGQTRSDAASCVEFLGRTAQETWYRNWYRSQRISSHLGGLKRGQPRPLHAPPGGRRVAPFPT